VCDGAEVALHDAGQELVPVMLRHGAPTVVDESDKAEQEGGRCSAAAENPTGYSSHYCYLDKCLHTTMNTAARLMQQLRCAAAHLKNSHRFLQHASNTQRTQAVA
jgi:hypothetical protein